MAQKNETAKTPALPDGIIAKDLTYIQHAENDYPKTDRYTDSYFDLWYTERFGWCIPTLPIGSGRGYAQRTYAVTLTGDLVRIGAGPHVLAQQKVYVRASRQKALQAFIDIRTKGQAGAGDCRDRISTRRAQTIQRRGSSSRWGW